MAGRKVLPINLLPVEKEVLEKIIESKSSNEKVLQRAGVILTAGKGYGNTEISKIFDISSTQVGIWRNRWIEEIAPLLKLAEKQGVEEKLEIVTKGLSDKPGRGRNKITDATQENEILILAQKVRERWGGELRRGEKQEIARTAINMGIVREISPRSIGRLLEKQKTAAR